MGDISIQSANALGIPVDQPHSLQATIELVYVQSANDILYGHLQSLQSYLATTQNALSTLTQLQNLHNDISVHSKGNFLSTRFFVSTGFHVSTNGVPVPGHWETFSSYTASYGGHYESVYYAAASAFFGTPVKVSAMFPSGFAAFQSQILALKTQISTQIIPQLSAASPSSANDPNSLLGTMKTVLADLNLSSNQGFANAAGAFSWIQDNYNTLNSQGAASGGTIQQDLTNAINAGESLNTTQTEEVRNYLYLFEEYYKSAASILQQITTTITKMADGISR